MAWDNECKWSIKKHNWSFLLFLEGVPDDHERRKHVSCHRKPGLRSAQAHNTTQHNTNHHKTDKRTSCSISEPSSTPSEPSPTIALSSPQFNWYRYYFFLLYIYIYNCYNNNRNISFTKIIHIHTCPNLTFVVSSSSHALLLHVYERNDLVLYIFVKI